MGIDKDMDTDMDMNMGKDTDICMDTPIDIRQTHACGHEHGH
jgi:hypothetical protein